MTGADRHPVHTSTVSHEGIAVLLVGASLSGESSLAKV